MSDDAFAPWQRVRSEPLAEPLVRPTEAGRKFGLGGACHQAYVDAEMGVRRGPLEGRQVLLAAVRAADDPDHPWPALGLLAVFDLPNRTFLALKRQLLQTQTAELTLRELMDATMLDRGATTINLQTSGLLVVRGVSKLGVVALATALTKLDLGEKCNALWFRRVAKLKGRCASIPAASPAERS